MQPSTHYFDSTGEAYNASQTRDEITGGDVLVVVPEGVVGIMVGAWPTAVTVTTGEFHGLAEGVEWSAVPSVWDDEVIDYSESHRVALQAVAELDAATELRTGLTADELDFLREEREL